jgi:magnesium transporter
MLTVYVLAASGKVEKAQDGAAAIASGAFIWADLYAATEDEAFKAEEARVEAALGVDAPTPLERAALEESARFYEESGALYLHATIMGQRSEGRFIADAVTFILAKGRLVTVRSVRPRAFEIGQSRASARIGTARTGAEVLMALLDGLVERIADIILENTCEASALSARIFSAERPEDLHGELRVLGRIGSLMQLAHVSLSSLSRMCAYAGGVCHRHGLAPERFAEIARDIAELERSAEALQSHAAFLLDAANGLVAATQNNSLKAISTATVLFVPPTLVASIFGMNFEAMTWFHEGWGPWVGFSIMLAAPAALFAFAKWRKWF